MALPGTAKVCGAFRLKENGRRELVAETGTDGYPLTANGATAAQYRSACLGLHTRAKTMGLHTLAAIGLKCALGHENALLFPSKNLRLDGKF
jgi:hypothetical protein